MRSYLLALLVCVSAVSAVSAPAVAQAPLPYPDPIQPHIPPALLDAIVAAQTAGTEALYCAEGVVANGTSARFGLVRFVRVERLRVATRFAECVRTADVGFIVVTSSVAGDGSAEYAAMRRALENEMPRAYFGAVAYTVVPMPHPITGQIIDWPRMLLTNRRLEVVTPRGPRS